MEIGNCCLMMSLTVRLLDVYEGPKFIHLNQRCSPTLMVIKKSSWSETPGVVEESRGISTSFKYSTNCFGNGSSRW